MSVVLTFALAASAQASAVTPHLSASDPSPAAGQPITFTDSGSGEYPPTCVLRHEFSVDGQSVATKYTQGLNATFDYTFPTAGDHTVTVNDLPVNSAEDPQPCGGDATSGSDSLPLTVNRALDGTIASEPDPPRPNQTAALTITPSGGYSPYKYAWDTDDDGAFDDGIDRTVSAVFKTTGPHVVRVQLTDKPGHKAVVSRTFDVSDPPPGTPPPKPSEPCTKSLGFQLARLTTSGCFKQTGTSPSAQWETKDAVTLNGIAFPDNGQRFAVTFPTPGEPGGHIRTSNTSIPLGDLTVFSGDVDWTLPAGGAGDEKVIRSVPVPKFARLFGLGVRGSVAVRLGLEKDGAPYATFPLNVELPAAFKVGPDETFEGSTGAASVRTDDGGVHFDGLKLKVSDVYVGKLKVDEACFSYVPAGGRAVDPCETPSVDGKPYLKCETDTTTDRWDGSAVIELPTPKATKLAAFGGLADGRVSKLGGIVEDLGTSVPIASGIYLNRVGVGLCLEPPPFKLRGDVGISAFPTPKGPTLGVNGYFLYTDATRVEPWSLQLGGTVKVFDLQVGEGSVTFRPTGDIDFSLSSSLNFANVASLSGGVSGWVQPRYDLFQLSGNIRGCLLGTCAQAAALVSSTGVAGCVDLGTITVPVFTPTRTGYDFGPGSATFRVTTRQIPLRGGFGHRWDQSGVDLLGDSCNFAPYSATKRSAAARAAGGPTVERIAAGAKAVTLRVHGTDGPPKLVLRGPDGTTITSSPTEPRQESKGKYLLLENSTDGTTSVLLMNPAAGDWTVSEGPAGTSSPTTVDRADFEAPPTFVAKVGRTGKGAGRIIPMVYAVPDGASVRLVERGKQVSRTIARSVRSRPCPDGPKRRAGQPLRCAVVKFTPGRGPGGIRQIEAVVTRGGIPLARTNIASYRAPRETPPSQPARMRIRRSRGTLVLAFPASRGASRYSVSAKLSDGRKLGFDLGPKCRAVRVPAAPRGIAATFQVAGVRYDRVAGSKRTLAIKGKATKAGTKGRLRGRVCS